jgi:hypothetical protein
MSSAEAVILRCSNITEKGSEVLVERFDSENSEEVEKKF